jgi:plastocyanin
MPALCLSAALVLASCSQTDPTAPTTPSTSSPTPAQTSTQSTPATRRIDITVKGKQVTPTPAVVNINVGESLTIAVTSDHNDQLHAHGFEIEKDIKAGHPLVITVRGAQPGVYDIELHNPELRLLQVAVR